MEKVEIIEEDKGMEKITIRDNTIGFPNGEWTARNMDKAFAIKINELIDEVNKLKGEIKKLERELDIKQEGFMATTRNYANMPKE